MGLSTAYHLAKSRGGEGRGIVVVEKDPTYSKASATLSAGGIRQQFSLKENVQMSLYGLDFIRGAKELLATDEGGGAGDELVDLQFQECGYLFLAGTKSGVDQMKKNNEVQISAGATNMSLLSPAELREKFPWLNVDDVLKGSYGAKGEGWFDPWALIRGLKAKCHEMGVEYVRGRPVSSSRDLDNGRVLTVNVEQLGRDGTGDGTLVTHHVNYVVNAAGPFCRSLLDLLATPSAPLYYPIPVRPRKRCIFFFHCSAKDGVPPIAPLTIDPSMVYFRSEGDGSSANFLCGVSPSEQSDPDFTEKDSLDVDHDLFDDIIWPALYHRVPAFGEIKVKSSWAGLYEFNTVDHNCIIGFHPEMPNVLMLNGFSGHGLQQSPASGRAGAELIDSGEFQSLDLSIFGFRRFMEGGEPVFEQGII